MYFLMCDFSRSVSLYSVALLASTFVRLWIIGRIGETEITRELAVYHIQEFLCPPRLVCNNTGYC